MELSSERIERLSNRTGFLPRYVEKVVRLLNLLEEIQNHPDLKDQFVLKGGTALNVFLFDLPRLSVDIEINWALTGSTSFCFQGVPADPGDIDIQTDEDGAFEIAEPFSDKIIKKVEFSSTCKIRSHFGALKIEGILVELMGAVQKHYEGEWEDPVDLDAHKKIVEFEGMEVPVLKLAYEYRAYRKLGRTEKTEKLKEYADEELA